jgi:hypothetical protein
VVKLLRSLTAHVQIRGDVADAKKAGHLAEPTSAHLRRQRIGSRSGAKGWET